MLQGITIQLICETQTGTDGFHRPVYTETAEDVENVLVGQPTTEEVTDTLNLTGKHVVYVLGIPKGDAHDWTERTVVLPAPFAGRYRTIGFPVAGIEANIPLLWNKKVKVERFG